MYNEANMVSVSCGEACELGLLPHRATPSCRHAGGGVIQNFEVLHTTADANKESIQCFAKKF